MKIVSVIIPAYNTKKYIAKCLDSTINQTYTNLEIIVIDDGSPDELFRLVEKYKAKDNRIKLYRQDNKGLSGARNKGIENSTGEYILFLDSDDWLERDSIKRLVENIYNNKSDIVMPDRYTEVGMDGKKQEENLFTNYEQFTEPREFAVNIMIGKGRGWRATSVLYKNDIIKKIILNFLLDILPKT